MKRPILIGTPEIISLIPYEIQRMLDNEGIYIGSNPSDPRMGEAPIVSMGGKVYSMVVDKELDPTRFIEGHRLDGPFRAGTPSGPGRHPDRTMSPSAGATETIMKKKLESNSPSNAASCSRSYFPGMDCQCAARSESECGCPGVDWTPTEVKKLRESATFEHAGCTASAMGWAIKYANIHELALRLVQAKGRFQTQKAFEDLREFISSENA